jgi:tRNA 2-thiouridine synthesizing protein B
LYALTEALQVNGIEPERIIAGVELIDYAGWVALTVKNPVIHTWN